MEQGSHNNTSFAGGCRPEFKQLFIDTRANYSGVITASVLPIFRRNSSPVPMCSFTSREGVSTDTDELSGLHCPRLKALRSASRNLDKGLHTSDTNTPERAPALTPAASSVFPLLSEL
jgi:hypothetical protein